MDGWEQTSGPDGFVSVSDGQLRVDGTRNGHNTSTSGNSTVYGFENEAADTGIPERFDPIVDPRGRGFSRNGDDAVTPDVYADGTQAYYGLERASGNVLYIRPREQPLSEPRTEPVSVALNRPDTYGDGTKGTAGILLYERVAPSNEPPIRVVHNDGKLRAINGESLTTLQPGVFGQWVHVDIFAIDLTNDTYSVRWTSPVGDGVRHNLDMAGAMTSGYRTSILSADGEAYLDNLVIRESNTSTCQGTQGSTASTPQCSSPTVVTRTFILPEDADAADLQVNATASGEGTAEVTAMRYPSNSETVSVGSGEWSHTFSSVLADDAHDVPDAGGPQQAPENDTVTLRVRANGTQVNASSVKLALDTDGDGLTDNRERAGVPTVRGNISTDPQDRDSDDDDATDDTELGATDEISDTIWVNGISHQVKREAYVINSYPHEEDSDGDGLLDGVELNGWEVPVVTASGTEKPLRFERECTRSSDGPSTWSGSDCSAESTIEFTSDPLTDDTDHDGLSDYREYHDLYTDPDASVTYAITERHQQYVRTLIESEARAIGIPVDEIRRSGGELVLTDATDDFDFRFDRVEGPNEDFDRQGSIDRFTLEDTNLGGAPTDTWYSNQQEQRTDPWTADTDADGLTDGQEQRYLTEIASLTITRGWVPGTNPTDPDSDGDTLQDGADRCPTETGPKDRDGCVVGFSKDIKLPNNAENALIHFRLRPIEDRPYPGRGYTFTVSDGEGNSQDVLVRSPANNDPADSVPDRVLTRRVDLSQFDGETVTIELQRPKEVQFHHFTIGTDNDQDGLIDAVEDRAGWELPVVSGVSVRETFSTSSNLADSDNDGLTDGEEVTFYRQNGRWRLFIEQSYSNPTSADTDQDRLSDVVEKRQTCTLAYVHDSDLDGQIDSADPDPCDPGNLRQGLNENGRAMLEGGVLGETGMPEGILTSGYNDNPGYVLGWISVSATPVVEIPADLRDGAQNVGQGDYGEAALDGVGLAPVVVDDAPKAIRIIRTWIRLNPGKQDELIAALRNSGLLDDLGISSRNLVSDVARHKNAELLADSYSSETLDALVRAGSSGGGSGDDILDEAADAARAGKADDVARLSDELDAETFGTVMRRGKIDEANRLLDYGLRPDRISRFADEGTLTSRLDELDTNLNSIYQQNSEKFTDTLTTSDIDRVVYDRDGNPTMLLDTNKWVSGNIYDTVLENGPGWRHVVYRHVSPSAPGDWPTTRNAGATSIYPDDLSPAEVKDLIEVTVRNGNVDGSSITYSGSKLDEFGVDEMLVIRGQDNGVFVTAYPPN